MSDHVVTTRSRTLLFISFRDSRVPKARRSNRRLLYSDIEENDDERAGLIPRDSQAGSSSIDMSHTQPKWVDIAEQVEDILTSTLGKIVYLDKLHAKHVLPGFTDRTAEEREIEAATTEITRDFRQCQALIQKIATPVHSFPPASSSRHEHLAALNVQRGLAAKVQALSNTFRKKQRVYMDKLQGHATKTQDLLIASGAISLKGSESLTALEEDLQASRQQLSTQELLEPDLAARGRELAGIAQSIASLAELFKDLSVLVIDQGTIMDSVEYNIEQTVWHMEEAVKELNVATRYQKNTGRRMCIFLLLLIIFGLVLVLIFKPRRQQTSGDAMKIRSLLSTSIRSTGA